MDIINHRVEQLIDPTGILVGERYECFLTVEMPEDDELFTENGLHLRLIISVHNNETTIVHYDIREATTENYLDFELDEEELAALLDYCRTII